MTISQILTLMGPTPSICGRHRQCHCGDSEVAPEMSSGGPVLAICSSPGLLQGLTCSSPPSPTIPSSLLLCMLKTLTPGSQTSSFARLRIPGLGHLSVTAEMRENPTCTAFCQAHCQASKHELVERESKT